MKELSFFVKAMGWRKRQMVEFQLDRNEIIEKIRNTTLEEVAKEIEKMHAFEKDTMASFAAYVRNMKK